MMSVEEQREMDRLKAVNEGLRREIRQMESQLTKRDDEIKLLRSVVEPLKKTQTGIPSEDADIVNWRMLRDEFNEIWSALEQVWSNDESQATL